MNYKSISIVGVDGAGKSSIIEKLGQTLGEEKVCVQYMGARLWETSFAKKYHENKSKHTIISPLLVIVSFIYEMFHRVNKYKGCGKLVVFDRYVDEQILLRKGKAGFKKELQYFIFKLFLGVVFHKPNLYFYLTCPIEVSVSRKNDITTEKEIEGLKSNKTMLDGYYLHHINTTVIDTSKYSQGETLDIILNKIAPLL